MALPKTKKQLEAFRGLTGYYRNYVPKYAGIAVPLSDLTKKGKPNEIQWNDDCEKSFNELKRMLTVKPVLKLNVIFLGIFQYIPIGSFSHFYFAKKSH